MEIAAYRPAPHVLDAIEHVTLVAVVGPSGAGKTTLMEAAIAQDPQLHLVLSHTSRPPRPGEKDGVDYHFRSYHEMLRQIEDRAFVQVPPSYTGSLYATAPQSYTSRGVSIMAVIADAIPVFRALPFKTMRTVFIVPPGLETWQQRLQGGRNALGKRLDEARRSFHFALADNHSTYVINNKLSLATNELLHVAHGHALTSKLIGDQAKARTIIKEILAHTGS